MGTSDGHFAAYVEDVMVHERYRGGGLGAKVLATLLEAVGGVGQVIMHRGEMES